MSTSKAEIALANLEQEVSNFEKALIEFIEVKKMMPEHALTISHMNAKLQRSPIAIIGMASIFPQARTLQEYWENIIHKVDCITDIPSSRWDLNSYYDKNPRAVDKTYCKRGGFIPEVDFDPMEFGIPPKVLEVTDVSQLLSLLVAKEALEDAGYGESRPFDRERTGVILGVALARQLSMPLGARLQYPIWEQALKSSGLSDQDTQRIIAKIKSAYVEWEENAFPGMLGNIVAGRIANRLDLGGTNCVVDAACASSIGALAMAMSELVEHRADMMLTGGVDTDNSVMAYICFSKTPAVSPGEKVKPFDADADGMMLGEGIGLMVLKRLEDAERDGDRIYAVIKGVGSSSDGRYKSIYAPRPLGQIRALRRAYEDAGFAPSTVGLIEAHGTGTMAGDPAELESLREVLAAESLQGQQIALGTVKSQIGHTKAAAGAASLIKTALALHHKILPATINVNQPHPKLNHGRSPLYLNTETRPWIRTAAAPPRRAGISSFGFGGTNYHVVLEEYQDEQQQPYRLHRLPQPLLLSAANPQELLVQSQQILQQLNSEAGAVYFQELTQNSCGKRIPEAEARLGFVAESLEKACVLLQTGIECLQNQLQAEAWEHPRGIYYRRTGVNPAAKVVALFSGQGCQYLDMGRELVNNFPELRQIYCSVDALFEQAGLEPLSRVVFPPPQFAPEARQAQAERLKRTEYAQAAIAAMSVGLYKLLQQAGFEPDFLAGHSFGELTALWAAGVLTQADYFSLVKARGLAMAAASDRQPDAGLMLAVKGEVSRVAAMLPNFPGVAIANHNSPRQVVLAGAKAAMTQVQGVLQAEGYGTVVLPVAGAFHTAAVGHAQKPLAQAIAATRFHAPQRPVYSNVTGAPYPTEPNAIQQLLMGHLTQPVQFQQEIENLYAQGSYFFIEFGPKGVLTHLVREILGDRPHLALSCNSSQQKDSDLQLRTAMVQLRVAGLTLDQSDPYQLQPPPLIERKHRPLCIQLTGANYVSDKTRQAFVQALQDGHRVTFKAPDLGKVAFPGPSEPQNGSIAPAAAAASTPLLVPAQDPLLHASGANLQTPAPVPSATAIAFAPPTPCFTADPAVGAPPAQPCVPSQTAQPLRSPTTLTTAAPATTANSAPSHRSKPPGPPMDDQRVLASLEHGLAAFNHHHDGILKLHEQALQQQGEYTQICLQLMQQQQGLFATESGKDQAVHPEIQQAILQSSERSLQQFHHHQGETLRLHEQCLNYQLEQTKIFFQLIQQQYQQLLNQPAAEAPLPPEANFAVSPPQPLPSPTDSLDCPHPTPATVAGNGIGPLNGWNGSAADGQEPHPSPLESPHRGYPVSLSQPQPQDLAGVRAETLSPATAAGDGDIPSLSQTLMAVVAEKTGYPPDLLELEMDLEADLGIDSIKRVEILGALQETYPGLPEPDLEKLAALRTLAEVVDFMATGMPPVGSETGNGTVQPIPAVTPAATPAVDLGTVPAAAIPPAPLNRDQAQLSQVLLQIVSEKTGYPADLLELEMDMEADLGIDSIKRVEILGALQEAYPGLPEPDLENLTALRTLDQVLELIQTEASGAMNGALSAAPPVMAAAAAANPAIHRCSVQLQGLPEPDRRDFCLPQGQVGILTDDGSLLTTQLAQALTSLGWNLVVLSFPDSLVPQQAALPTGVPRIVLEDVSEAESEAQIEHQLSAIAAEFGPIAALIHLNPASSMDSSMEVDMEIDQVSGVPFLETEAALLKQVFFLAKHLQASLNQAAQGGNRCFLTVARLDGALGLAGTHRFGAIAGGLAGLTKTLQQEWPSVHCRALDLAPDLAPESAVQAILAEIHDPNRLLLEVSYGPQGRGTLVGVPDPLEASAVAKIGPETVFLVSGGAKGITAECVVEMAQRYQCKFILLGRSMMAAAEPVWARDCLNETELKKRIMDHLLSQGEKPTPRRVQQQFQAIVSRRQIAKTLTAIATAGGQAEYLSVDVTDGDALKAQLAPVIERFGPITGIIHGAGTLADKRIEKKSEPDFSQVYAPKVKGLENLLNCVNPDQLTHLILFSSVVGFYGNVGQSDYAIANEILNKSAHLFHHQYPNCHSIAINWGPWDSGMVTPELQQAFAERKITTIAIDLGPKLLLTELASAHQRTAQVMIGSPLSYTPAKPDPELHTHRLQRQLTLAANPFLQDHQISGYGVLPATCAFGWIGNTCAQLYPGYQFFGSKNFKVLKGIVFDPHASTDYVLEIREIAKSQDEIALEARVSSQTPEGKVRHHFSANVTLQRQIGPAPIHPTMDLAVDGTFPATGESLYQQGPTTLFHGPAFQGVQKILNISPEKLTAECWLSPLDSRHQGQFPVLTFNPYIADVQIQGTWLWMQHFYQQGCLPAEIREYEQFLPVPFGQPIYVSCLIQSRTATSVTTDIITHDRAGRIYNRMLGAKATVLPG